MKRISVIAICATVILSLVGCQKGVKNPYLELSKNIIEVPAAGGDFSFDVSSNIQYTVNQTDKQATWLRMLDYTEKGEVITYNLRVAENTTEVERSSEVTFIGEGVTPQRLTVIQAGLKVDEGDEGDEGGEGGEGEGEGGGEGGDDPDAEYFTTTGLLAEWDVMTYNNEGISTWDDAADNGNGAGDHGKYMPATGGIGEKASSKIRYNSVNKSSYVLEDGGFYTKRESIGKYRRLMVYSCASGDEWLYSAVTSKPIAPGSRLKFSTYMSGANACPRRWIVEYKDGSEWKPIKATTTMTETATSYNYIDDAVNHSLEITYNYDMTTDKKSLFEAEFTIANAMSTIEIRVKSVGYVSVTDKHMSNHMGNSSYSAVGYKDTAYPYISLLTSGQ